MPKGDVPPSSHALSFKAGTCFHALKPDDTVMGNEIDKCNREF